MKITIELTEEQVSALRAQLQSSPSISLEAATNTSPYEEVCILRNRRGKRKRVKPVSAKTNTIVYIFMQVGIKVGHELVDYFHQRRVLIKDILEVMHPMLASAKDPRLHYLSPNTMYGSLSDFFTAAKRMESTTTRYPFEFFEILAKVLDALYTHK